MSNFGHNESAVRLAALAGDAQVALDKVARGEADAIDGWLAYGAALNEGRALFAEDKAFGRWIAENLSSNLEVHPAEQSAAMWAAANADQLAEAKATSKARTLRGWHDQWKKIEGERDAEEKRIADEADRAAVKAKAEGARKEAESRAKSEAEARAAAVAAKDDDERKAAEARADKEAEAKKAAEQEAEQAEAEAEEPAERIDPEVEKVMRKRAGLTREALLRDYAELAVASKAERAALKAEVEGLKSKIALFEAEGDIGRKLGMALRENETLKGRLSEHMQIAKREEYKRKKAEARVAELERMEIPLC